MTKLASRSVSGQLKVLGLALVVLIPIVAAASLWNLTSQSRDIRALTTSYTPAFDANNAVLIDMTGAYARWSQLMGGSAPQTSYRGTQDRVSGELATVARALSSPSLPAEDRTRYAALLDTQRAAIAAWFRSAAAAEDGTARAQPQRKVLETDAMDRFGAFRDSNRGLYDVLRVERDAARDGARRSVQLLVGTAAVTVLLAMVIVLKGWRLLERSVSSPLERLRSVVERQRDGDRDAQADTGTGAAEIRALAADFNGLTRSNQALQEQQSVVLLAHQLALDVARVVHGAPEIDTTLHTVCAMLGEGLSVDRIILYTHDESGVIDQRTQWHRDDLPDLPALPVVPGERGEGGR